MTSMQWDSVNLHSSSADACSKASLVESLFRQDVTVFCSALTTPSIGEIQLDSWHFDIENRDVARERGLIVA
jgi:hypothetical protein